MHKTAARQLYKEKRAALTSAERLKLDDLLLIQLQTIELPFISFLLSYWPIEQHHEPNTHLFTDYLEFLNPELVVCYPKTEFDPPMLRAIRTDDDTKFRKNRFNIYEPEDGDEVNAAGIDIVFVPLLACDKNGYRIGFGKGMYDRYLQFCRKDCLKIGFSYFELIEPIEDAHQFDVPLNLCVTPGSVYEF